MLRCISIFFIWVIAFEAGAIVIVWEKLREMTPEEIKDATNAIHARYPNAKIDPETTAWFLNGEEAPQAHVRFESEWSRVSSRFCQAESGEQQGSLSSGGTASWERLTTRNAFRVLHEQPGKLPCVASESSRHVNADHEVSLETVAWVFDHEGAIWSQYLALAMSRYGVDYGLTTVPAKLTGIEMMGMDLLELNFSGEGHISYHARLRWIVDRWVVTEAFISMP